MLSFPRQQSVARQPRVPSLSPEQQMGCSELLARGSPAHCCLAPPGDWRLVLCSAPSVSQSVFTITEKAPTRAFSWLKAPTSAFTFKTLLRHYAKRALTP